MSKLFAKETDLVAAYREWLDKPKWSGNNWTWGQGWTAYAETAGWDLLLVNSVTGLQIGIEAKLALNAKVIAQALSGHIWWEHDGPDYRAVLVPDDACQHHMSTICAHLGLTVISLRQVDNWRQTEPVWNAQPDRLPQQQSTYEDSHWHPWLPAQRCPVPEYVPDVIGGAAAPVALTPWKIKAIRLMILLERNGSVTRRDMKDLDISPTRWTSRSNGYLEVGGGGYIRSRRTPDLKAQHPRNWAEIEADFDRWNPAREKAARPNHPARPAPTAAASRSGACRPL